MLTQCPNCRKAIVVPEPGIHDCSRCHARIWIYPYDSDNEDRVLISPETLEEKGPERYRKKRKSDLRSAVKSLADEKPASWAPPWENREQRGVFMALLFTWRLAMLFPTLFFSRLKADQPVKGLVLFGWICMTIGYVFWGSYRLLFLPLLVESAQKTSEAVNELDLHFLALAVIIAAPLLSLLSIYLNAALYQAVLQLLGVTKPGFRGSLRVSVYACAPMLLLLLPFFGDFLAFIWSMILSVIGIAQVHRVNNTRAMLVVLLPPIAFYVLLLLGMRLAG